MMNFPKEKHIAFSISAGCYFYQLGIAYYIQKHFDLTGIKYSGASGGGWPAVLLAAGINVKDGFECVVKYAPECCKNRPFLGAYMVYDKGISIVFEKLFEGIDLPTLVNGHLVLSVTRLAWTGIIPFLKDEQVTNFYSNDDIRQCIIASALIPFCLNGRPYVIYRGWICADGGITNVTGVRHFAEELVHDIEWIEEGLVEQAHQLSDHLISKSSVESLHHPHHSAPMSAGPYGIVRFGATVSQAFVALLTDSFLHFYESGGQESALEPTAYGPSNDGIGQRWKHVKGVDWGTTLDSLSHSLSCGDESNEWRGGSAMPFTSGNVVSTLLSASTKAYDTVSGLFWTATNSQLHSSTFGDGLELCGTQECWPDSLLTCPHKSDQSSHVSAAVSSYDSEEDECVLFGLENTSNVCSDIDNLDDKGVSSLSSMTSSSSGVDVGTERDVVERTSDAHSVSPPRSCAAANVKGDGLVAESGTYWRVKGQIITKTPGGGVQLEISPWMWRHQPVWNYHLSADPGQARKLFEMGIVDACEHHWDLLQFFDPDEYTAMLR